MRWQPAILCLAFLLGCGDDDGAADAASPDSGSVDSGGLDGGGSDAGVGEDAALSDAGADAAAACDGATEGGSCSVEGLTCGGPCPDECTFCNLLVCTDGRWTRREVFPASCFDCGPTLQCVTSERYCLITMPGVAGGENSYECALPPVDCESSLSCECLMRNGVIGDCREEGTGEIIVELAAP